MSAATAAVLFLVVCLILAVLLVRAVIPPVAASAIFAIALAGFGLASRGFRKRSAGR
jgi:hypothetical protein